MLKRKARSSKMVTPDRPLKPKAPAPRQRPPLSQEQGAPIRWASRIGALAAVVALGLFLFLYQRHPEAWQLPVAAGLASLVLVGSLAAAGLTYRGRVRGAGVLLLLTFLVSYSAGAWILSAPIWALLAVGVSIVVVIAVVVLPGGWWLALVAALLCAGNIWLANQLQPLPRFDLTRAVPANPYLPLVVIVLPVALVTFVWLVRTWRQGTIRSRLLATSVLTTTLLALAISATSALISVNAGREAALARLDLTATILETEIAAWTDALQADLETVIPGASAPGQLDPINAVLQESPSIGFFELARQQLLDRFAEVMRQRPLYEELSLLNIDGKVIVSSDPAEEGSIRSYYRYFEQGLAGPYLQPPFLARSLAEGELKVVAAIPAKSATGQLMGVLIGSASLNRLDTILSQQKEANAELDTYLVSSNHALLTGLPAAELERYNIYSLGVDRAVDTQLGGTDAYNNLRGTPVLGAYRWIPKLDAALVVEESQASAYAATRVTLVSTLGVGTLGALLAGLAAMAITRSIADPLSALARTAEDVAAGNLTLKAEVRRDDETGVLAQAFNAMTDQLSGLIASLEQRVADRTSDLERRSRYLEGAAQVGRAATHILEPDQLVRQVVELIRERFDLYYVGLFLVDPTGEWARLQAGTGEAGRSMLARGHRIRVGEGMVGWSVAHAQSRIALEAGEDAVRLATAELPETRSEAAIPLISRGQTLGAITVQDSRPGAFDQDSIAVLQTMADQVAVALDNARLFEQGQAALEAERQAYGELSQRAWLEAIRGRPEWGYRFTRGEVAPVSGSRRPEMAQAIQTGQKVHQNRRNQAALAVPLKVREQIIGALYFSKPETGTTWSQEEIELLETVTAQVGEALESARLYQQTQHRAETERVVGEISTRLRQSLDIESVLRTAAEEARKALGLPEVLIRMVPGGGSGDGNGRRE